MNAREGILAGLTLLLLSGCRTYETSAAKPAPSPHPSIAPAMTFAIPVGMLPVNVVGSYGGGNALARRMGAGKHPIPSGVGVPIGGSSLKESAWTCMVLLYGSGAAVQYEGMGRCGTGLPPAGAANAVCEIPLPKHDPAQTSGKITTGWCIPDKRPKLSRK